MPVSKLSHNQQIQAIVDWISPYPSDDHEPEDFSGPLRDAWCAVQDAPYRGDDPASFKQVCIGRLSEIPCLAGSDLLDQIRIGTPSARIHDRNLYEIGQTLAPIQWLWEQWLPIGMLSMLAARPGTGKSLVALDFIRMILSGSPWPDGTPQPCPGANCIYVDAENVPSILNQRAEAWETWGMDRRRVWPLLADDDDVIVSLADPKYARRLEGMADRLKPALIVVDSLRDILPNGESAIEDVRDVLALLSGISVHCQCAVMLIHHLRKGTQSGQAALFDTVDLDQVSGSGYIGGRARVIMGLCKVQTSSVLDKNGPRKLEVVKTNLGVYPEDIGIDFQQIPPDGLRLVYGAAPQRYEESSAA